MQCFPVVANVKHTLAQSNTLVPRNKWIPLIIEQTGAERDEHAGCWDVRWGWYSVCRKGPMFHDSPEGMTAVKILIFRVRCVALICHSWLLVSASPWQTDSLLCREKTGGKIVTPAFKFIMWSLTEVELLTHVWNRWVLVSCVRKLTLERGPLQSHWLKKPVVKNTEEKTLQDPGQRDVTHTTLNTHHQSHHTLLPAVKKVSFVRLVC